MTKKPANLFPVAPNLDMAIGKRELKNGPIYSMDFWDYESNDDLYIDLDRETLKGVADFIYKYLENN